MLGIAEWLHRERSPFQEIAVARLVEGGRALFLDGVLQLAEADEFVYHEHLVLPALLAHPEPRRVMIAGGGDGLALREVLRDPRVAEVVLVELDGAVLEACRIHLGDLQKGALEDPRVQVEVADALAYLCGATRAFDLVFVDLVDAYGSAQWVLYREVLAAGGAALADDGLLVLHGDLVGAPWFFLHLAREARRHFPIVRPHRAAVASFGGDWGFALAGKGRDPAAQPPEVWSERAAALAGPPRALRVETFPAALGLPPWQEERLSTLPEGPPAPLPAPRWLEGAALEALLKALV
ncbi:MAG: hypothetical protein KatS3mg124_1507 [Porticoccaceae bacterium]|nr:MAG: hypothetical protein KatS3mg124_1507 [Porticoccaceae bacterium]